MLDLWILSFALPLPSIIIPTQAPILVWGKNCHVALIIAAILHVDTTVWYNLSALVVTRSAPPPSHPLNQSINQSINFI